MKNIKHVALMRNCITGGFCIEINENELKQKHYNEIYKAKNDFDKLKITFPAAIFRNYL